jgi:endonuclease YncB( thermonuclease family)
MQTHRRYAALFFLLVFCLPPNASALAGETITCRVVGVHDGDTITVLTGEKQQLKIRLTEIDAPEDHQPFGAAAKKMLSEMIFGKQVVIKTAGKDRYRRTLGRVFSDAADINLEMVKAGGAWAFTKYVKDPAIPAAQSAAQAAHAGLWALPDEQRIPPWEWRKQRRHKSTGG